MIFGQPTSSKNLIGKIDFVTYSLSTLFYKNKKLIS